MRISKGSYHSKILPVMSTCKLKINVNLSQMFYFVVSAAQNGEFERFEGFCLQQQSTFPEKSTFRGNIEAA